MNKFARRTAIVFAAFYLLCACLGFVLDFGHADENCDTYALGPAADGSRFVHVTAEGTTEMHLESRDELCTFFYTEVLRAARAAASVPVSPVFLMGCFEGGDCDPLIPFGLGLLNALLYAMIGFILGKVISLPFQRTSKNQPETKL